MNPRHVALSLVVLVSSAATARPEAVAIDHKAVGCIIVGKYPKMDACFTPAAELARSRVYFRPEGVASWYYVDMKSEQPCFTGTLPRPGKKLVGKKIEYYVEAQNKAFEPARTAEFDPIVVKSAQECKKNVPVAPFLNNATVAVFPAVPAGFVGGGIGTAAIIGIAGAGAAAAGTAAVVASNNNDTTTTTVAVVVNSTTTTTTLPATTTTTTLPSTNHPPLAVLTTNPDPPSGQGPLTVTFDLCKSTDPDNDPLSFFFDFGDGSKASGSCLETHTYQASFRATADVRASDKNYVAEASVVDPGGLSGTRTRNINVTSPPPPPPKCPAPTITITSPADKTCLLGTPINVTADATATATVVFVADRFDCSSGAIFKPPAASASVGPTSPGGTMFTASLNPPDHRCYRIGAQANSSCSSATADATPIFIAVGDVSCPFGALLPLGAASRIMGWSSDLAVAGGRLRVVINGSAASFPGSGRVSGVGALADGTNRFEVTLVESAGKPGTWTFEMLAPGRGEGTIRVVAGDVQAVTATSVTFRLRGVAGERVVFTFDRD